MQTDVNGRAYVNRADAVAGLRVEVDNGFDCMAAVVVLTVAVDEHGEAFVPCTCGRHYLDGQDDGDGALVGIYLAA